MGTQTTVRLSKEERRREIVKAAMREFATGGLYGTPVEAIARRAGVSQPYVFQLFGTKRDLFIAAVRRAFERTIAAFRKAAAGVGQDADTQTVLIAMGLAYCRLLQDRGLLLMQLQACAACKDEQVRQIVRDEVVRLVRFVQAASGAGNRDAREWLAEGMLMNVAAAMDLNNLHDDRACVRIPGEILAGQA